MANESACPNLCPRDKVVELTAHDDPRRQWLCNFCGYHWEGGLVGTPIEEYLRRSKELEDKKRLQSLRESLKGIRKAKTLYYRSIWDESPVEVSLQYRERFQKMEDDLRLQWEIVEIFLQDYDRLIREIQQKGESPRPEAPPDDALQGKSE